jgi:hypothetical protein
LSRQLLNGWKEISNHLDRGVRTAQRWEALLGMPVHRPSPNDRSAVVAFSDELDRWISRLSPGENDDLLARVKNNANRLACHIAEVESQTRALEKQVQRALAVFRRRAMWSTHAPVRPAIGRGAMLTFSSHSNATIE